MEATTLKGICSELKIVSEFSPYETGRSPG